MSTYRVAEVAEKTGIPATTLRYYDEIGLAQASVRSEAGYRLYDERALERLRFIVRAKQLGLALGEIKTLAELWDGGECGPVQREMARLVDEKIFETAQRNGELVALANELQAIAARLRSEPHAGACDDTCACVVAPTVPGDGELAITCTLATADVVEERVRDWQTVLAEATARESIDGGLRIRFAAGPELAGNLARLAAMEVGCCDWVEFTVAVAAGETTLEVRAPEGGMDVVTSMFGSPSV